MKPALTGAMLLCCFVLSACSGTSKTRNTLIVAYGQSGNELGRWCADGRLYGASGAAFKFREQGTHKWIYVNVPVFTVTNDAEECSP